jgi:D-alanine-D-alanine ligase
MPATGPDLASVRVGVIYERKAGFPFSPAVPSQNDLEFIDSELRSEIEVDQVISALRDAGRYMVRIGDGTNLIARLEHWNTRCDIMLPLSVGYRGLDSIAWVPSVLEQANIPYVGSQSHALRSSRHKFLAKQIIAKEGVQTPPAVLWEGPGNDDALSGLTYPVIVKPLAESSSIGIHAPDSVAETPQAASVRARWVVSTFAQPALVEQFISGTEVEVPLLGWPQLEACGVAGVTVDGRPVCGDAYLTAELVYADRYDFTAAPSGLDLVAIEAAALRAARALGMRDYGQIDFRVADDGTPYFMDAAATPHLMRNSSFHTLARARGRTYPEMLDEVLTVAMRRVNAA